MTFRNIVYDIIFVGKARDSQCYADVQNIRLGQGSLTEGEGSVPLTSSLRQAVL
jgi:hypothetical protein